MTISSQLIGNACGHHGPYTFYRTFGMCKNGKSKSISIGQFFFIQIDAAEPVCVGELQLLWEDKNINRTLTSCCLYYLPENTPEGRHGHHGEDEVLAVREKVVLRVEDLVQWIVGDVRWDRGLKGCYSEEETPEAFPAENVSAVDTDTCTALSGKHDNCSDKTDTTLDTSSQELVDTFIANNLGSSATVACQSEDQKSYRSPTDPEESTVKILSYANYCRYRGVLKRLENVTDTWLRSALVVALGGFTVQSRNCRLFFCRDTFEHPLLESHELLLNHLAPTLRGRPRKKRLSTKRSNSPSSESNENNEPEEWSEPIFPKEERLRNGMKKELAGEDLEEQEFLQRLFKFMRKHNTPIERVPHLGFKQINLYFFYTYAQKLGGYDKITIKKLWKHIYDELGGNPGSTSAATCTRRHYERLLLPFERFLRAESGKRNPRLPSAKARKNSSASNSTLTPSPTLTVSTSANPTSPASSTSSSRPITPFCTRKKSTEVKIQTVTPCPQSPSVPSPSPPTTMIPELDRATTKVSPCVTLPMPPSLPSAAVSNSDSDNQEPEIEFKKALIVPHNHMPQQVPVQQLFQQQRKRAKDEKFAEKERMWDEIRRQNAIERDRIRQLTAAARSSCTSSRVVKAKDMLTKPMGVVSPLEPLSVRVSPSQSMLNSKSSCKIGSTLMPSQLPLPSHPKRIKVEKDEYGAYHSWTPEPQRLPAESPPAGQPESCTTRWEKPNGWQYPKNDPLARPTVIQHTQSVPSRRMSFDTKFFVPIEPFTPRKTHSSGGSPFRRSPSTTTSIPPAHSKSTLRFGDPNTKPFVENGRPWPVGSPSAKEGEKTTVPYPETGHHRFPGHWTASASKETKVGIPYFSENGQRLMPSRWATGAACEAQDDVALDLSVKKDNEMEGVTRPNVHNPSRTTKCPDEEVQELDLSTKHRSKHLGKATAEDESFGTSPQGRMPCKDTSVSPRQGRSDFQVMPGQYYIADDKSPAFFPDYGSLLPHNYYGLSFPLAATRPGLVPEQLQSSLAAYKELFHKGVLPPGPYPSFAFSSHLYPSMYKEHSPYLYLPK